MQIYLKKLSFPRLTLPIIVVGSSLINFLLMIFITYIVLRFLGHFPIRSYIYYLPLLLLYNSSISLSLGLFFGIINVFIVMLDSDRCYYPGFFWFWLTPVVYMLSIVPERFHSTFFIKPNDRE